MTTLDIQKSLSQNEITLSKKEINAWLKSLNSSQLISKADDRGKPTTINYEDRYTYDKWSITSKGLLVSTGLNRLRSSIEQDQTEPVKDLRYTILSTMQSSNNPVSLNDLKDIILEQQEFDATLQDLVDEGMMVVDFKKPSIFSKFLSRMGVKTQKEKIIWLTTMG